MQELRASCCSEAGHTSSPVRRRRRQTLPSPFRITDETDRGVWTNQCAQCEVCVLAQTHNPEPSQNRIFSRLRRRLMKTNQCPEIGSCASTVCVSAASRLKLPRRSTGCNATKTRVVEDRFSMAARATNRRPTPPVHHEQRVTSVRRVAPVQPPNVLGSSKLVV